MKGSLEFLEDNKSLFRYSVVSGSDQKELRSVCEIREISNYFIDILGSPTDKTTNVRNLIAEKGWNKAETILIGDSINDYNSARENGIMFIGRNSGTLDWSSMETVPFVEYLTDLFGCISNL